VTDPGPSTNTTEPLLAVSPRRRFLRRAVVGGPEVLGRRARAELERNTEPEEKLRFCLRGDLGHALIALEDRILIIKGGFHAGTTFGAMTATIFYPDVTGIQLRMHLVSGWIEISSPSFQGRERKHMGQPRSSDRDVYKLPNCVPINRRYAADYRAPLAELRRLVAAPKLRQAQQGVVIELERLAALHRDGLLDGDEFAAAKARIIGGA